MAVFVALWEASPSAPPQAPLPALRAFNAPVKTTVYNAWFAAVSEVWLARPILDYHGRQTPSGIRMTSMAVHPAPFAAPVL
jgi:hypothetical protein